MLSDVDMKTTIAVKDMDTARRFYGETLGLKQVAENEGGVTFQSGNTQCFVYVSEFAGTNQATTLAWDMTSGIEQCVEDLKAKGVSFEHYDFDWAKLEGDLHVMNMGGKEVKSVWFKDPDGNILNITQGM